MAAAIAQFRRNQEWKKSFPGNKLNKSFVKYVEKMERLGKLAYPIGKYLTKPELKHHLKKKGLKYIKKNIKKAFQPELERLLEEAIEQDKSGNFSPSNSGSLRCICLNPTGSPGDDVL